MCFTMVDAVGLEPTMPEAADLQSAGVTNFPTHPLERVRRIELLSSAWKAEVMAIIRHPQNTSQIVKEQIKNPGIFRSRVAVV